MHRHSSSYYICFDRNNVVKYLEPVWAIPRFKKRVASCVFRLLYFTQDVRRILSNYFLGTALLKRSFTVSSLLPHPPSSRNHSFVTLPPFVALIGLPTINLSSSSHSLVGGACCIIKNRQGHRVITRQKNARPALCSVSRWRYRFPPS